MRQAIAKGVPHETIIDVVQNFVHGFSSDQVCLNASTWSVNHSADPNVKVELSDGKYRVIVLRPMKAGDEIFMDYKHFVMGDFYVKDFCGGAKITDVKTIALTATAEIDKMGAC